MDKLAYSTFNQYRELTKQRAEINKQIEAIKPSLRSYMTDGKLLDEETGEVLVEVTTVTIRQFDKEGFYMLYKDLYEEFCADVTQERINIKAK